MAAAAWSCLLSAGLLALFLSLQLTSAGAGAGAGGGGLSGPSVFTSSFLVRFRRGVDNGFAHEVADKYGFDNLGPVSRRLCEKSIIILPSARGSGPGCQRFGGQGEPKQVDRLQLSGEALIVSA